MLNISNICLGKMSSHMFLKQQERTSYMQELNQLKRRNVKKDDSARQNSGSIASMI